MVANPSLARFNGDEERERERPQSKVISCAILKTLATADKEYDSIRVECRQFCRSVPCVSVSVSIDQFYWKIEIMQ